MDAPNFPERMQFLRSWARKEAVPCRRAHAQNTRELPVEVPESHGATQGREVRAESLDSALGGAVLVDGQHEEDGGPREGRDDWLRGRTGQSCVISLGI